MLMSASPEFIALCQSQVVLAGNAVGAHSTAVYLAENWRDQSLPELVPVAIYPPQGAWAESEPQAREQNALPGQEESPRAVPVGREQDWEAQDGFPPFVSPLPSDTGDFTPHGEEDGQGDRVVIPLVHENVVMGVLVSWRRDRPWQSGEQHQLEQIAQTLSLACVLDQRGQWIQSRLQEQRQEQLQQSKQFHELLHQVRNPLTALRVFGKLLTKRLEPSDRNHSLARGILQESDRMTDLLGYFDHTLQRGDARLTATATVPLLPAALPPERRGAESSEQPDPQTGLGGALHPRPWHIAEELPPLLASAATLAQAQGFQFQAQIPENFPAILADPTALREVITSLLENAFKYAPSGSLVWVEAGLTAPGSLAYQGILVGDTGPGIPPGDQPHIFERQYRGVQAQGEIAGTGLGLAIVADLIHRMGGQVEVYSPLSTWPYPLGVALPAGARDRGTAFVVWLPVPLTP